MATKNNNKKRIKKTKDDQVFNREIVGLFFIVIGIISFVSIISTNMGVFGRILNRLYSILGGSGNFLIPLLLIIIGALLNIREGKYLYKVSIPISIIFLCVLIFLDRSKNLDLSLIDRINLTIEYSSTAESGGIIGSFLGFFTYTFLGSLGTYILLFIAIVISLMVLFNLNHRKVIKIASESKENINSKFTDIKSKIEEKKAQNKIEAPTPVEETKTEEVIIPQSEVKNIDKVEIRAYTDFNHEEEKIQVEEEDEDLEIEDVVSNEEVHYVFPPVELLDRITPGPSSGNDEIIENGNIIVSTLENFNIPCSISVINKGPTITLYELTVDPSIKLNKIVSLRDNLKLALASPDIRIEAPIPGKSAVGIEVPNKSKESIGLREMISSPEFKKIGKDIPLTLGKDITGENIISTVDKMPHLLIAGATGSGKSVCINSIILGIIYNNTPEEVRLILIDPKVVELSVYNGIPHLLIPVVSNTKKASYALNWAVEEMEKRYGLFAKLGVRDLKSYNAKVEGTDEAKLPKIVIIVDELADLMMVAAADVEDYIARLAQMARAAGIHLIIATQRPSVDVITGIIKANIPSRIAFSVSSSVDSRTILDQGGAEKLLGKGDMLFYPSFYSAPKRVQGAFVKDDEVERVVDFLVANKSNQYSEDVLDDIEKKTQIDSKDMDPLFNDAVKIVVMDEQASISYLQRKLKVGYSRAARIVDQMEEAKIIGPHEGSKPRKLLMSIEEINELLGENIDE